MKHSALLSLLIFFVLLVMLPFVLGQVFTSALVKLKLEPTVALLVVIGIFLGSPINIPVKRISRTKSVPVDTLAIFFPNHQILGHCLILVHVTQLRASRGRRRQQAESNCPELLLGLLAFLLRIPHQKADMLAIR